MIAVVMICADSYPARITTHTVSHTAGELFPQRSELLITGQ